MLVWPKNSIASQGVIGHISEEPQASVQSEAKAEAIIDLITFLTLMQMKVIIAKKNLHLVSF